MCTNMKWVHNKYTGDSVLVSCGRCEACLQEKADRRARRIKNEINDNNLCLFVTLTYDRFSCPYVRHDDVLNEVSPLPVYRDCEVRRDPVTHRFKRKYHPNVIFELEDPYYQHNARWLPYLRQSNGSKVGVCIFKDVQDFNKRLRQNLKRKYHYEEKYRVFNTFEYGERTFRPHVHLCMFIRRDALEVFRDAIVESWPFALRSRTRSNIQIARNAAQYVASYVNCGSQFPLFIKANFPPKHSFSQGLGTDCPAFQLDKILECADKSDMSYNLETVRQGLPCSVNLPIPQYVINRYFPLFKGYSRLNVSEIYDLLSSAGRISSLYESIKRIDDNRFRTQNKIDRPFRQKENMIYWTFEDMFKIGTSLHNAYLRYKHKTGKSAIDFAIDYQRVYVSRKSTLYRLFRLDDSESEQYKFDNVLSDVCTPLRVSRSHYYTDKYRRFVKTKAVNNSVFSNIYSDV